MDEEDKKPEKLRTATQELSIGRSLNWNEIGIEEKMEQLRYELRELSYPY